LATSLSLGARLLSLVGDGAALDEWTDELVAIATEQGFPLWRASGTINHGWAKVKIGDVAEGISLLRSGSTAFRATGAESWMPYFFALLARAYDIAGQVEAAFARLEDASQIVEKTGARWLEAELNRLKGELLRQGHPGAAEELYCKALSIAEEQAAKLWELRAAVSLARLRHTEPRNVSSSVISVRRCEVFQRGWSGGLFCRREESASRRLWFWKCCISVDP
jgi:predicted ATPase